MIARGWPWRLWKRLDWVLLAAMLLLLISGVFFVFSAGLRGGHPAIGPLYQKQLLWIGLGLICFLGASLVDYHRWIHAAWWLYGLALLLLILVFVPHVGVKTFGAYRWIRLIGPWVFQPAELMKLALVLVLVRLFGWPGRPTRRWRFIFYGLALALLPLALIIKQPDMGTAIILLPVTVAIMFVGGVRARALISLLTLGLLAMSIILALIIIPTKLNWSESRQEQLAQRLGISPYQRDRILVFLNSDLDPLGAGWNKAQSQIAVGSGRLWGKGYLQGTQNVLGFLPWTVAPNDFIFSVIAEEKGFIGSLAVLTLFALIIHAGLRTAALAADKMGRLLCVGIVAILFCHVFVNIAMTIGVLPITGIPLPLLSYGGTFMVGTMTALGLLQSVYIRGDWR